MPNRQSLARARKEKKKVSRTLLKMFDLTFYLLSLLFSFSPFPWKTLVARKKELAKTDRVRKGGEDRGGEARITRRAIVWKTRPNLVESSLEAEIKFGKFSLLCFFFGVPKVGFAALYLLGARLVKKKVCFSEVWKLVHVGKNYSNFPDSATGA